MHIVVATEHSKIRIVDREPTGADEATPWILARHVPSIEVINGRYRTEEGISPFEIGRHSIRARQYVGVVAVGGYVLEILPKVATEETAPETLRSCLVRMLHETRDLPLYDGRVSPLQHAKTPMLEYFLAAFAERLVGCIRRQPIKRYVSEFAQLPCVRGRIDFAVQLRANIIHKERVACRFDEFEVDHDINRLLKCAARRAFALSRVHQTKMTLRQAIDQLDGVRDVAPSPLWSALALDRTAADYEIVFRLAKSILLGNSPTPSAGSEECVSLLFDMNRLFEEYIGRRLRRLTKYSVTLQKPRRFLAIDTKADEGRFQMRPDICIHKDGEIVRIMDTKWKRLNGADRKLGVSQSDMYQMAAYGKEYGCPMAILLYPRGGREDPTIHDFTVRAGGETIRVATVDILDPKACERDLLNAIQLASRSTFTQ
jgi:5-methylcytosine-specific restriction enzyme subunit McrC